MTGSVAGRSKTEPGNGIILGSPRSITESGNGLIIGVGGSPSKSARSMNGALDEYAGGMGSRRLIQVTEEASVKCDGRTDADQTDSLR